MSNLLNFRASFTLLFVPFLFHSRNVIPIVGRSLSQLEENKRDDGERRENESEEAESQNALD